MEASVSFSSVLSRLRHEKNINQRTASADLGISQALLSHYENGLREPGLAFVSRACDYYGVSADYLLGRTDVRDCLMYGAAPSSRSHKRIGCITALANTVLSRLAELGEDGGAESSAGFMTGSLCKLLGYLFRDEAIDDAPRFQLLRDAEMKMAEARLSADAGQRDKAPLSQYAGDSYGKLKDILDSLKGDGEGTCL